MINLTRIAALLAVHTRIDPADFTRRAAAMVLENDFALGVAA
jgi:hypothetical protein